MEFVKEGNRDKCRCEKCGTVMSYKTSDPHIKPVVADIRKYSFICPVCGNNIHDFLYNGKLDNK